MKLKQLCIAGFLAAAQMVVAMPVTAKPAPTSALPLGEGIIARTYGGCVNTKFVGTLVVQPFAKDIPPWRFSVDEKGYAVVEVRLPRTYSRAQKNEFMQSSKSFIRAYVQSANRRCENRLSTELRVAPRRAAFSLG
jgi:hypothetical protein